MFYSKDKSYIEKMIENYPIETLHIKGRLRNHSCEYYVDQLEKTEMCLIKHDGWLASFSENTLEMVDWLNKSLDDESINFCGLTLDFSEAIINGLTNYSMDWEERCVLYYLPQEKYEDYLKLSTDLDDIKGDDINIVYEHYTYKDEDSQSYLIDCINKGPSTMVKNQLGQAISWALTREDGSLGVMYTLEAYRKQGLALKVSHDLLKKVVKKGAQPYVHIVIDNTASRNLAEQLGMVLFGEVLWFGMKKNK